MADRVQIQYEYSDMDEYWVKLSLGNSSVVVGEAAGAGDQTEWEIIDGFNGQQLAFRRVTDDHTTPDAVWVELMTKAHHELLRLHRLAEEQAARDKEFRMLQLQLQDQLEKLTHMNDSTTYVGHSATTLGHLTNAVNFACQAYEAMDEVVDPSD